MYEIEISGDELVGKLLTLSLTESVCFLDSCGIDHFNSHLLIAGIRPVEVFEISSDEPAQSLEFFNDKLSESNLASIFTISYEFGLRLENLIPRKKEFGAHLEPDIFLAQFECLVVHDYRTGRTRFDGNSDLFDETEEWLTSSSLMSVESITKCSTISSNFSKSEYLAAVVAIQGLIRCGETYQANLTQQFRARLPKGLTPQRIFQRLRNDHPAPFAAFLKRNDDCVVSISPERFASLANDRITVSPVKGTRPRGETENEDRILRNELLNSSKDLAENTMIVDLLRNDIGRVCEFGSVKIEGLHELSIHPTLFHLVSTVSGILRENTSYSDVIRAIFPCGSITGCPKIRTMEIIDRLETANRGLSMGAIGYRGFDGRFDLSVAIRTIVIRDSNAVFNVGGGIVIDSDPLSEYHESLTKAKAIFNALNVKEWLSFRQNVPPKIRGTI